jgi:FkbM family methyltransferase
MDKKLNTLNQLKTFSFYEKIRVLLYTISQRIVNDTPLGLRQCYSLIIYLKKNNIIINKISDSIKFDFKICNSNLKICLKRNSSDAMVFKQVMLYKEYEIIIEMLKNNISEKPVMIDLGANIGLTSIYLKSFFPSMHIFALEPEYNIFKRLEKNIKINSLRNVTLLNKGIWSESTTLKGDYSFRDGEDWSFRLIESNKKADNNIVVISMTELMVNNNINNIDFLKIDIEGAEKNLFENAQNLKWLAKVKIIAIEIHDEFGARKHIEDTLLKYNFKLQYSGEHTIGVNDNLIAQ